jgi:hypothetical protein
MKFNLHARSDGALLFLSVEVLEAYMSTSFNSEELNIFASVFDRACAEMRANDEASRSLIALRILHLAAEGERVPERLLECAKHIDSAVAA